MIMRGPQLTQNGRTSFTLGGLVVIFCFGMFLVIVL
jgi:hypothetical protein